MRFPRGRIPSLLAWGLLVGGVALLVTFPDGDAPRTLAVRHIPGAVLFAVGGAVFGFSHPEGRVWLSALLLGWVPPLAAVLAAVGGVTLTAGVWLGALVAPGLLAAAGAWAGAVVARRREPAARRSARR
jgi:hypothetical protein